MNKQFKGIPGWTFDVNEVSAGVYRAFGQDKAGRNVGANGPDPDVLIEKCKAAAIKIIDDLKKLRT